MLIAALLALVQDDIKRVLAYSTISQLAYMMAALALGKAGHSVGLFHLFTHAFFKALLFLGAGSVIHAVHTNNMSEMGGLRRFMPVTFGCFVIATLALMGIPRFAGFWSKDEIIATAWHTHHYPIYVVAVVTAFLTALYMTRAVLLTKRPCWSATTSRKGTIRAAARKRRTTSFPPEPSSRPSCSRSPRHSCSP